MPEVSLIGTTSLSVTIVGVCFSFVPRNVHHDVAEKVLDWGAEGLVQILAPLGSHCRKSCWASHSALHFPWFLYL